MVKAKMKPKNEEKDPQFICNMVCYALQLIGWWESHKNHLVKLQSYAVLFDY